MLSIVLTELQKIKRYHILLIGIIGMALSPVLGLIRSEERRVGKEC